MRSRRGVIPDAELPEPRLLDPTTGTLEQYGPEPCFGAQFDGFGERVALQRFDDTMLWGALP